MSNELTLEKESTKIERWLKNQGQTEFISELRALDRDALNQKMLDLAKYREEIQNTMNSDTPLKEAKDKAKELEKPYKDDKKMNDNKRRFVALVMQEKGYE